MREEKGCAISNILELEQEYKGGLSISFFKLPSLDINLCTCILISPNIKSNASERVISYMDCSERYSIPLLKRNRSITSSVASKH